MTRRMLQRDALLALAALGAQLALLGRHSSLGLDTSNHHALDAVGGLRAATSTVPLVAWRRNVLAVFVAVTFASLLNLLHYPLGPPMGATIAVFLFAATAGARRSALGAVAVLLAAQVASVGIADRSFPTFPLLFGILLWTIVTYVGNRARLRLERRAAVELHARMQERTRSRASCTTRWGTRST